MNQNALINVTQFNELKDLLEEDFVDLVGAYVKDSETRIKEMQEAFESNDNRKGFEAAHSLKGASSNLGAAKLTELCYDLQEVCRANKINENQTLITQIHEQATAVNAKIYEMLAA